MIETFLSLNIVLLPLTIGFAFLKCINFQTDSRLFKISLAFGSGLGILVQWILILGIINIPFTLLSTTFIPLLLSLSVLFLKKQKEQPLPKKAETHSTPFSLQIAVTLIITYYVYFVFWESLHIPIASWDAFAAIAFKGKIFFYDQSLKALPYTPHTFYPLHIPLSFVWISNILGEWNDQFIKIIFPLYFLSFLMIFFYTARKLCGSLSAFIGLLLLCSSNLFILHGSVAYRDFVLLYYICSAIFLLLLWQHSSDKKYLLLSGFFAGFATFVKVEGTLYLSILFGILFYALLMNKKTNWREKGYNLLRFSIPSLVLTGFYAIYRSSLNIEIQEKGKLDIGFEQFTRLPSIITAFISETLTTGNWNLVWLFFWISLFNIKSLKKATVNQSAALAVFCHLSIIGLIAMFTKSYIWLIGEYSATGLSRIFLHLFPVVCMTVVLINSTYFRSTNLLNESDCQKHTE